MALVQKEEPNVFKVEEQLDPVPVQQPQEVDAEEVQLEDPFGDKYPADFLPPHLEKQRQEIMDEIRTVGKKIQSYPDEEVKSIWEDIHVNKLSDKDIADKYGCHKRYAWSIRHHKVRKGLLTKTASEYFDRKLQEHDEGTNFCDFLEPGDNSDA